MKKEARHGRLRDTFIFLFILVAVFPVLLLGSVTLFVLASTHRADVSRLEIEILLEKSKIVEVFLGKAINSIRIEASALGEPDSERKVGTAWQEIFAKALLNDNESFREVSFVNLQGIEVAKEARVASVKGLLNVSETPSFKTAMTGDDYLGDVQQTLRGPLVRIAAPVVLNGKVIQVVMAELDLSPMLAELGDLRLTGGRVLLFDRLGSYVSTSSSAEIKPGENLSAWSRLASVLAGASLDGLQRTDRYDSIFLEKPVIGAGMLIKDLKWPLLIEWPLADADTSIQHVRLQVLLMTLITLIVVVTVAVFVAHWLVAPIRLLELASRKIAEGDYEVQVAIQVGNELDELGSAFTVMAQGLKRLDELRKEFVFVAAHELRSPVTAIKGYLSLIIGGEGGPVSANLMKLLSPIQESNNRLITLIADLLEVARSEAGRLEVKTSPLDIRESVHAIMRQSASLATTKKITVRYEPPAELKLVLGDTERVGEVLMNLLSNAIKYTPEKGTVTISHVVTEDAVVTSVTDSGIGITPEDQKHLFEKFFRADAVKIEHIEGTGLGLFITKQLVGKMGGTMSVESRPQKGSIFSFSLKIAPSVA